MQAGEPNEPSAYAEEGTAAHEVQEVWVKTGAPPPDANADQLEYIGGTVQRINDRIADYKKAGAVEVTLLVEVKLDLSPITGEKNAVGTSDSVIIAEFPEYSVLEVRDLKYGMGVRVDAENNSQLMMYALAAVHKFEALHNFGNVVMVIDQPRISDTPSEWQCSVADLRKFGEFATQQAELALSILENPADAVNYLSAGEDQCRFCRAKHKCPEIAKTIHQTVFGDFQDIADVEAVPMTPEDHLDGPKAHEDLLPVFMRRVPLIEEWCTAIRAQVERVLMEGREVIGYKLVEGRKGARSWTDTEAVEKVLIAGGVGPDLMFKPKQLLTPAALEKNLKKKPIWLKVADLTKQSEGKPSVTTVDDPRPLYTPTHATDFETFDGSDLV
jgi:hypothetical protein